LLFLGSRQVMYSLVNEYPFADSGSADTILGSQLSKAAALR